MTTDYVAVAGELLRSLNVWKALSREPHHDIPLIAQRMWELASCGVCGGSPPVSGLPCICGGTGLARDEAQHARELVAEKDAEIKRLDKLTVTILQNATRQREMLEAELAALKAELAAALKDGTDR